MDQNQPHNIELEQAVIGALMFDNALLGSLAEMPPEAFFEPAHAQIFAAMLERDEQSQAFDAISLRFALSESAALKELGGAEYLLRLQTAAPGASSFAGYALQLRELHGRRVAMATLTQALNRLSVHESDMPAERALAEAEADLAVALQAVQTRPLAQPWVHGMQRAVESMMGAYEGATPPGISTGLTALDNQLGNMGRGEYLVLAGRPSMGKTALGLNIAAKAAMRGHGVFFGSLEMNADRLALRVMSQVARDQGPGVHYSSMRTGKMQPEEYAGALSAARHIGDLPIYTADPSCKSLARLRAALGAAEKQLRAKGAKLDLIVIDYLQLVEPTGRYRAGDTNGRVSASSEAIKQMARHFDVPVLCLSQLSRQVEHRDPPVPMLSDLRDSGSIEQDADAVLFAYRPEYYTQKRIDASKGSGASMDKQADLHAALASQRNRLTIITAKQRDGATGSCSVYCDIAHNYIADRAPQHDTDQEAFV